MSRLPKAVTLFLITILTGVSFRAASAQTPRTEEPPKPAAVQTAAQPASTGAEVGGQIEELKAKVDQLQSVVEQQRRSLAELERRVGEGETRAQSTADSGSGPRILNASLDAGQTAKSAPTSPESAKTAQAKEQSKTIPILAGWDDNHAFLKSADGAFLTYLTGYAQLDFRSYQSGSHPPNSFFIRRVRMALEGKILRYYDFKVEGDFADTSGTLLRDFYVRVHRIEPLQVTAGQFKEPFSQEELRADSVQDFVERSLVNNLAPSRSPGVMISGVLRKGAFEYQLGFFNGKGLLAANNTGTPEEVVRLRFAPWKTTKEFWLKGLAFGGAFARGRTAGGTSVRGQTESRSTTFFSPDTINGNLIRANGELTWLLGPAAIRAEYAQTNQARTGLGARGTNLPGVVAKGYMGQFTYVLTGENKPDAATVVPKRNLFGDGKTRGSFGAWELKARYASLQINDATAKSNRAQTFTFGANWYLNRFVRYLFDVGVERFRDPLRAPKPGDKNFFVILSRFQVAF